MTIYEITVKVLFSFSIYMSIGYSFKSFSDLFRGKDVPRLNIVLMALSLTAAITHLISVW